MLVIGLTGRSGSGKGYVSHLLKKYGPVIDADAIYHQITSQKSPCVDELEVHFGNRILREDGGLNRSILAEIVFKRKEELSVLNRIAHKYVLLECRRILEEKKRLGEKVVFVDAPQLFESGFDRECDYVFAVIAEDSLCLQRIVMRDGISLEKAKKRMDAQYSKEYFIKKADYILYNDGEQNDLQNRIEEIIHELGIA